MKNSLLSISTALCALSILSSATQAAIVYDTGAATGYFTPFDSTTPAGTKYSDSGYFGTGSSAAVALTSVRLGLATYSDTTAADGTADIVFTLNDGDPSKKVFGTGNQLYTTTIHNVVLPASGNSLSEGFYLTIPLPSVLTTGGYNNVGWSIAVQNYNYAGSFGFQNHGDYNSVGYYTNNAYHYTPSTNTWSGFAFGPNDPGDIANFVAQFQTPEPASMALVGGIGAVAIRRRRAR